MAESFGNLLEPVVALQAGEQCVSRLSEMAFELQDLRITILSSENDFRYSSSVLNRWVRSQVLLPGFRIGSGSGGRSS